MEFVNEAIDFNTAQQDAKLNLQNDRALRAMIL